MKRFLSILLITIMIISCFSGCASTSSGRQVCLDFLSCISEKDYIGAYALLDDSIKLDMVVRKRLCQVIRKLQPRSPISMSLA